MPRLLLVALALAAVAADQPPNVVILFADDLGYADIGCFGAKNWNTPNLDRIAREGVRLTDFHASQPVCSASRTSLLTGCYANRLGIHGALGPNAKHGIHADETTLAEVLKAKGYATGMVGKWHLGHRREFLPTRHGFDCWFGLPYSNDMWPHHPEAKKGTYPPLPLFDNETAIDADVSPEEQATLTRRYTDKAVEFVRANADRPFFLYFAHTFPHVPLFAGEKFRGRSKGGLYGDVIEEFDAGVGELLAELDRLKLDRNTLVLFTSDNGPWLSYGDHAGSAGPLREGKGTVFEGGVRVPFVARLPGVIPAGSVCGEPAMTIDLLPTIAKLAGADLPTRPIDGKDIGPLLTGTPGAKCPHAAYFHYFAQNELQAVRSGKWKLMLPHTARSMAGQTPGAGGVPGKYKPLKVELELYDLTADIGEMTSLAEKHPEVVKEMLAHAERARADMGDALTKRTGTGLREPGRVP